MLGAISAVLGFGSEPYGAGEIKPFYEVGRPGFFGGFGSYLDIFSPLQWDYARLPGDMDYDLQLIGLDWYMVGHDLCRVLDAQAAP